MAQANSEENNQDKAEVEMDIKTTATDHIVVVSPLHSQSSGGDVGGANGGAGSTVSFKFNAHAPEFVPRSHTQEQQQMPISGYLYPCFQFVDSSPSTVVSTVVGSDWFYISDQDQFRLFRNSNVSIANTSKNSLTADLLQKITKQVEYLFSDLSLLANDTMAKHVSKDPEGYVPVPVIGSMKKIKALIGNHHSLLMQALRSSTKLVVSSDGKKVRRRNSFNESYKEELQCRIVVAENLPDDHSYQNLEKLFGVVGSVKAIRLCHPQETNASRSKTDVIISNKLHALVEYENAETAERAVEKLNDERNWRKGLRVRVLLRCSPKSVLKSRKSDLFDVFEDDDNEGSPTESAGNIFSSNGAELGEENPGGLKKTTAVRGRGKTKGRGQVTNNGRGLLAPPTPASTLVVQCDSLSKPAHKGPRMPDGTRGFAMGRGKPLTSSPSPVQVTPVD